MIGREIGTYKILEQIGEGGMGVVYKGIDTGLDRLVAIKVLTPELVHNPELIDRFRSEAKAQANLNHTNIATLYAFMQVEGQCLIVMEYLEGETFEDLILRGGKLPWRDAVGLARQALQGLGFAHGMGIVHRDIKPSNLMLTASGTVKIMDFGIAKALGGSKKTRTGLQMGTPHYMSPEQIRGRPVDARSDIYSLGITFYQLLSGDLPFQSDSDFELMSAHINTPPPVITTSHADIPKSIEQCVMKALAKEPEDRYQSTEEFGTGLQRASRLPADLLDTKEEEIVAAPKTFSKTPAPEKATVQPAHKKTEFERKTRIEPQPPSQPELAAPPRKRLSMTIVAAAAAALVGAVLATTFWSKLHQPTQPDAKQTPVVQPQTGFQPSGGGAATQPPSGGTKADEKKPAAESVQKASMGGKLPQEQQPPAMEKPAVITSAVPQKATLLVLCNLDCTWTLDGQPQAQLSAGRAASVRVPFGQHTIAATTLDRVDQSEPVTFSASSANQVIQERVDLLSKQTQRQQFEGAEKARQAEIAKQAEIERQRQEAVLKASATPPAPAPSIGAAGDCQLSSLPQTWRNVATNGRYHFRFDCEHIYVYELPTNRIVADLSLKRNKKDSKKDKYTGETALSPCRGGGKMEILGIAPTRIEAKVEVPAANNQCSLAGGAIGSFFASWASASFIPE